MLAFYLICCVFNLRVRYLYLSVCGVLAAGLLRKAASQTPLEQELISFSPFIVNLQPLISNFRQMSAYNKIKMILVA